MEINKKRFIIEYLNLCSPIYFFIFVTLRCYIETEILSVSKSFSYYLLFHHILWYGTAFLALILVIHLILKVRIKKLMWLMYGVTFVSIPLIYSIVTGNKLQLKYLKGKPEKIILDILTFCFTEPDNRPLTIELIVIFISILIIAYLYSQSWKKAVITAVACHITLGIAGIEWIGKYPYSISIIQVKSVWPNHTLLATFYLTAFTLCKLKDYLVLKHQFPYKNLLTTF